MTKFQKSPALQLVIVISFYFGFGVLVTILDAFISPALTGYSITSLGDADSSSPNVVATWKLFAVTDTILMLLVPALLFARWISPHPLTWLRLDKPLRLWPALFVVVIVLAALPVRGFLYDWNCTWSVAKASVHDQTRAKAIIEMPNFISLPIGLLLFTAIPAIARVCFFFGMMQKTLLRMMPKTPWIAILITSVIFSACFFDWDWFAALMFIGFLLGTIYYLSDNLWLSVIGLFIFMSTDWVKSYLVQHGVTKDASLTPSHTPWYMALIGLFIMVGLVWYLRKRIPKPVVVVNDYQTDIDSIGK